MPRNNKLSEEGPLARRLATRRRFSDGKPAPALAERARTAANRREAGEKFERIGKTSRGPGAARRGLRLKCIDNAVEVSYIADNDSLDTQDCQLLSSTPRYIASRSIIYFGQQEVGTAVDLSLR